MLFIQGIQSLSLLHGGELFQVYEAYALAEDTIRAKCLDAYQVRTRYLKLIEQTFRSGRINECLKKFAAIESVLPNDYFARNLYNFYSNIVELRFAINRLVHPTSKLIPETNCSRLNHSLIN